MTPLITIAPRYTRSVNVERDALLASAVDGYVLTSTPADLLSRFIRALSAPTGHRAWSVTGPYGTGKSAFAVFVSNLLGSPRSPSTKAARTVLMEQMPQLYGDLFDRRRKGSISANGYCSVVLTAGDEPLSTSIIRALQRDVRRYCTLGRPPASLALIDKLAKKAEASNFIPTQDLLRAITETADALQRSGRSQGVLLIIDELGRFLEFAARNPEKGDIYVLQMLAEATASFKNSGLAIFTFLHQSFDRYAAGLRPAVKDEWAKVQGRFEDVAFFEAPEEFLLLLASAIKQSSDSKVVALRQKVRDLADQAHDLGMAPRGMTKQQFRAISQDCVPLHPVSVLTLSTLCRKFGQHQRSLFSFLVSRDSYGLTAFVEGSSELSLYTPDMLHDFVAASFGSAVSVGESGTRWAEIQAALDRVNDASKNEQSVVKTIGLLAAAGVRGGLKPSREVLELCLGRECRNSIQSLIKRSVVVYRKHADVLALWEGSDVDIEARLSEATTALPSSNWLERIMSLAPQRPLVAKRHSVEKGTLRFFSIRYADLTNLGGSVQPDQNSDGILIYGLPNTESDFDEFLKRIVDSELRGRADVLFAICKNTDPIKAAARQLELLYWVERNTPELQSDAVARRELRARIRVAATRLQAEIDTTFAASSSAASSCTWIYRGITQAVSDPKSLSNLLSNICDKVYASAPQILNELLNRRGLSTAAAAARRNLIAAMLTRGNEANLGIDGTPPEMSMYASLLGATGIHRREESGYSFGPPLPNSGILECWNRIEEFFESCELQRRSIRELWEVLQQPPYGVKLGPIPVLFCAAMLAHDTEIALYESSAFVPEPGLEHFERLMRDPGDFELRRYRIEGVRRDVYNRFAALLDAPITEEETLVAVVRPLYRFFNRLPAFTKQTASVSKTASAVREALLAARDPDDLLFKELPVACGYPAFLPGAASSTQRHDVDRFFAELKRAHSELQRTYDDLLSSAQNLLFSAFGVSGARAREILRYRAQASAEHAVEPRLRALLHHLSDEELDDASWIEAIGSLLASKPPKAWSDSDRARYEVVLSELARNFRHVEALSTAVSKRAKLGTEAAEFIRIGVTDRYSADQETVVVVEPEQRDAVNRAVLELEESLKGVGVNGTLALAALAIASRHVLEDLDKGTGKRTAAAEATK